MTKVWIEAQRVKEKELVLAVNVQDAPPNLFGISFHLAGDGADWELSGYHIGQVFGNEEPVVLVTKKDGSIVTGIALTREDHAVIQDGNLITFSVQLLGNGEISFDFDYPVLSVMDNGRKDLTTVEWQGLNLTTDASEEPEEEEIMAVNEPDDPHIASAHLFATDWDVHNGQMASFYTFLGLAALIFFLISAAYYWYFRRERS